MGFFVVPDPEDEDLEPEDDRPDHAVWIAGHVSFEALVARTDAAAVAIHGFSVYPDAFEFTIDTYVRESPSGERFHRFHGPPELHDAAERLHVGLLWADGGRATNLDGWGWPDATEPAHGLRESGGGGSDRQYSQSYSAWPTPTADGLQLVVEWPEFDIDDTYLALPAADIAAAAERAHAVWEDEAHLPRAGWFGPFSHSSSLMIARVAEDSEVDDD